MKRCLNALAVLALALALPGIATAEGEATFTSDVMQNFGATFEKLIQLAEAAPEDKFSWAPSDEVRTLSEVYMHAVGLNLVLPSMLGAAPPEGLDMGEGGPFAFLGSLEKNYTTKEEVVSQLKSSYEYAMAALPTVTDLETEVNIFFPGTKRAYVLVLLTHAHEHLGQAIAYSRSVGIVPPWSQPADGDGGR